MSSASLLQNILAWKTHYFSSGSYTGEDFQKFSRQFKLFIKDIMLDMQGELLSYNKGHYYVSAFVKRADQQIIYISISDVRGSSENALNSILVRTAKHDKDFTGGANHFSQVEELSFVISKLK